MTDDGFTCTLRPEEAQRRTPQLQALAAQLLDLRHAPRQAVLRFPTGSAELLHRFVADESRCCTFFDFDVTTSARGATLEIGVPAGAEPLLDDLLATLRTASFEPRPGTRTVGG